MQHGFAWVLNLDAELELARGRPGYVAKRKLTAQLLEHGGLSKRLLGPDDIELGPGIDATSRVGRAWCPTPLALAQLRAYGASPEPFPDAAVLRRVNHRLFAHELGGALPEQVYVTAPSELRARLGDGSRDWLLKRPLTFAGRGQLRALGPLTPKQWTWVDASLAHDGLIVEPLVTPRLEASLHGFVWPDRHFELGRICVQDVSERGAFRGVRLAAPSELSTSEATALFERAEVVARELGRAGYFGPFGIDGYRYDFEGQTGFCALSEINARYTLGFVVGFPRHPSELRLA